MKYDVTSALDMQNRVIGTLTCDDDGVPVKFEGPRAGTQMFQDVIANQEPMPVVLSRYRNFVFTPQGETDDDQPE